MVNGKYHSIELRRLLNLGTFVLAVRRKKLQRLRIFRNLSFDTFIILLFSFKLLINIPPNLGKEFKDIVLNIGVSHQDKKVRFSDNLVLASSDLSMEVFLLHIKTQSSRKAESVLT